MRNPAVAVIAFFLFLASNPECTSPAKPQASGFPKMDAARFLQHIKVLSSDRFEGRAPGTKGEDLSVAYIEDQFKKIGLAPGNTDGSFTQKAPMAGVTPNPTMTMEFRKDNASVHLKYLDDFVAWTRRLTPAIDLKDSPLLFVGYGVEAPEFKWDDYQGIDVRGKTLVMLINDPPVPDPRDPSKLDPNMFGGKAMTYYGRWTYKYDIGGEKGAAGVILIHETGPAGYPWHVIQGFGGERFELITANKNLNQPAVEAWIDLEQAKKLFAMAGQDFYELKKKASIRGFQPIPLGVKASIALHNSIRNIVSRNVLAKIEGADPRLKNEFVIYTAHWDHLGIGHNESTIYHGAVDNASGVAGLFALAEAFKTSPVPSKRSILFIADTGEEQGLLGAEYYANNPVYPLAKTLAAINLDGLNMYGRTKDLAIIGLGNSDLDDYVRKAASKQSRAVTADPEPEKGLFYRADHFPFAQKGVPALFPNSGIDYIGKPAGYGRKMRDNYTMNDYHKPSDAVKPDWDLSGAIEDLQLLWMVGRDVANANHFPKWKSNSEFKPIRKRETQSL